MLKLIHYAHKFKEIGFSIFPVDFKKQSVGEWKEFQGRIMTDQELISAFSQPRVTGIAIICGNVSGGLEVLDIDSKYDLKGDLFEQFVRKMDFSNQKLLSELVISATKNDGYHFLYRTKDSCNYELLARRNATQNELVIEPKLKSKTLIECLGNGRYAIEFPTPGYEFLQNEPRRIPFISPSERALIKHIARSFNEYVELKVVYRGQKDRLYNQQSPLNDFNAKATVKEIIDLLIRHGWSIVCQSFDRTSFRRPGNSNHPVSGNLHHVTRVFIVYSPHTEFQPGEPYNPAAVFAFLECNRNFRIAAKALLQMGYGIPYSLR